MSQAEKIYHYLGHIAAALTAAYYWYQHNILKDVIENKLQRRHNNMLNPLAILSDISLAAQAVEKLQAALPQLAKLVADAKQASADKNDPVKLYADIDVVLADLDSDLTLLAGILPKPAQLPPPAAPVA